MKPIQLFLFAVLLLSASFPLAGAQAGTGAPLDLTPYFTRPFFAVNPRDILHRLPQGTVTLDGIIYQVDGIIELTGMAAAQAHDDFKPGKIGLAAGKRCIRVHILHKTIRPDQEGVPVSRVTLHFENGKTFEQILRYGHHTRDLVRQHFETTDEVSDPSSTLIWQVPPIRLFRTTLEVPWPEEPLELIAIQSLFSQAMPVIAAITLEKTPAGLPSNSRSIADPVANPEPFEPPIPLETIQVQIRDQQSGEPIRGAIIKAHAGMDGRSYPFARDRSDLEGKFDLVFPRGFFDSFVIDVTAPERMPARHLIPRSPEGPFLESNILSLAPGQTIGGIAVDPEQKPVPGATITASTILQHGSGEFHLVEFYPTESGPDGRWSIGGIPPQTRGLVLNAQHPDYLPVNYLQAPAREPGPLLSTEDLLGHQARLILDPGIPLRGRIFSSTDKPVAGARVVLGTGIQAMMRQELLTDDQGGYTFHSLQPGPATLLVIAEDHAAHLEEIEVSPDSNPVIIRLSETSPVSGRVADSSGEPVPSANITVARWDEFSRVNHHVLSDPEGLFHLPVFAPGEVQIVAVKPGYQGQLMTFSDIHPAQQLEVTLIKPLSISGTVVDAENKQPIPHFQLFIGYSFPGSASISWDGRPPINGLQGKFNVRLENHRGPSLQFRAEAPDYLPAISEPLEPGSISPVHLELKRGEPLELRVLLPDGSPAQGALAVLCAENESAFMREPGEFDLRNSSGAVRLADDDGLLAFPPKAFKALYIAHENGFFAAADTQFTSEITLAPWGKISGKVFIGTEPAPQAKVMLTLFHYPYSNPAPNQFHIGLRTETDSNGLFQFEKVPPGEFQVGRILEREGGMMPMTHAVPVKVQPDEEVQVQIGGTGRLLYGLARFSGENPPEVIWEHGVQMLHLQPENVPEHPRKRLPELSPEEFAEEMVDYTEAIRRFWASEEGRAAHRQIRRYALEFDQNGSFQIQDVPPGRYELAIQVRGPVEPGSHPWNQPPLGSLRKEIIVPNENPDAPLDLGILELQPMQRSPAPGPTPRQ